MKNIYRYGIVFFSLVLSAISPVLSQAKPFARIYPDTLNCNSARLKLVNYWQPARKSVGLALSGGGARGIAQIGILKALEEKHIPIDAIAGTSIGSIVGGLYSSGYSAKEIEKISQNLNWDVLTSLNNSAPRKQLFLGQKWVRDRATVSLRFDGLNLMIPKSLSSAQDLATTLDLLALNAPYHPIQSFESLRTNYRAVAADLVSGKRVLIQKGSVSEAMRASSTVPLLFMPVKINDHELVDGGLVSNLPVDALDSLNVDIKVALNTMGTLYHSHQDLNLPWKTADQVIGILMIKQNSLQLSHADMVITPELGAHESANFSNLDTLLSLGYQKGLALADSLNSLIFDHTFDPRFQTGAFRTLLQSSESLPDSLEQIFLTLIRNTTNIKDGLHQLLKTDLLREAYADVDSLDQTITYHIKPLPRIRYIRWQGATMGLSEKLNASFHTLLKTSYTNSQATSCLEDAIKVFRKNGYPLIQYEAITVRKDTLVLTLSSGKLSEISIERSRKSTKPAIIERELFLDTTSILKPKHVQQSLQALYNMNIFDRINMWPSYSRNDSLNTLSSRMIVNINERFSEILRFGFRFDDTYNSQFMLDFRNENFLGRAIEFGGWMSVGSKLFTSQIEFRIHRLWDTYLTAFSKLYFQKRQIYVSTIRFSTRDESSYRKSIGDYGQQFYGFSSAIGGHVFKDGQATLEFLIQNAQVYPEEFKIARESNTFKTIRSRFTVDNRDEPFEAESGTALDIYYDFTPKFLGNEFSFSRLIFSFQENVPVSSFFRYRVNLNLGIADNLTPLSHQFSMGGVGQAYSIPFYGFQMDDFRGRQIINFGLDLNFDSPLQLVFPTSLSIHYNLGNMWNELSSVTLENMYHGLGIELSLKTPLGPARMVLSKAFIFEQDQEENILKFGPTVFNFVLGYEF